MNMRMGCDAVGFGRWVPTFCRNVCSKLDGVTLRDRSLKSTETCVKYDIVAKTATYGPVLKQNCRLARYKISCNTQG